MDKIIKVKIDKVTPYKNNPRIIDKATEAIKESIKLYGFVDPVYVDKNYVIIVGHARYQAAKELGLEEIEIIVWDIPEEKARPYRLVDNKIHEYSTWDNNIFQELKEFKNLEMARKLFPEFSFNVGQDQANFEPVSSDQVKTSEAKSKVKFSEFTAHHQNQLLTISCPKCAGQFNLKKADVINDIKYKGSA